MVGEDVLDSIGDDATDSSMAEDCGSQTQECESRKHDCSCLTRYRGVRSRSQG